MVNLLTNLRNHNIYLDNGLTVNKFFGGFFNINVFTNQRHLVFGFGLFFVFVLLLYQFSKDSLNGKTIVFSGLVLGLLPFWHNFVFLAVCLVYSVSFFFLKKRQVVVKILVLQFWRWFADYDYWLVGFTF